MLVLLLVVLVALQRIASADYSLWFDELASVFFASQRLDRLWSSWMVRETNPPLFYSVLHVWSELFGQSVTILRLPSIIASLFAIAVVYLGARRSHGAATALACALLMALSAQQLFFAHQVRSYMLLFLAIAVSFFGLARIASGSTRPLTGWSAYVGGATAAAFLHTTAFLWPVAAALALITIDPRFRPFAGSRWRELALASIAILLATSWWLGITILQLVRPGGNLGWISLPGPDDLVSTFESATLLARHPQGWGHLASLFAATMAVTGAVRTWHNPTTRLAVACGTLFALLFVLVSLQQPIILTRTLFCLSLFIIVLAGAGIASFTTPARAGLAAAVAAGLLGQNLVQALPLLQQEDWRTPIRLMAQRPGAVVLVENETMGVATRMACAVELGRSPCPFRVVTLIPKGTHFDHWASGYASRIAARALAQSDQREAFLFSRWCSDVLAVIHEMDLLERIPQGGPSFLGPYPSTLLEKVLRKGQLKNGLLHVKAGPSCR